jgi:alpha-L-fucosidase
LGKNSQHHQKEISKIEWVPTKQPLTFERAEDGLIVSLPQNNDPELSYANAIRVLS